MSQLQIANSKKPYRSPCLVAYGDLRRITQVKAGTKADSTGRSTKSGNGAG